MKEGFERVYTVTNRNDGVRSGIADLRGCSHLFQSIWDTATEDWQELFILRPIDEDTLALALEDWEIWVRWENANRLGNAPKSDIMALPEDQERYHELLKQLGNRLKLDHSSATFRTIPRFRVAESEIPCGWGEWVKRLTVQWRLEE